MNDSYRELCKRLAIIHDGDLNKIPERKMGRQMVSWSFISSLEKYSHHPVQYLKPKSSLRNIREGNFEQEALFVGDPNIAPYSEERLWDKPDKFSIIGITHTLSTPGPLNCIPKIVHAPVFPWDALICTSNSAKDAVNKLWNNQEEIILARGGSPSSRPQLPVIPLGIDVVSYKKKYSRDEARNKLRINREDNVVLWTGRLEVHCKAHHSATFKSLQIASDICNDNKWILLMYGTSIMPNIKDALKEAAAYLCSSVEVRILDGHNIELGEVARSASDMFISLADSYQETFGLTPIEAMASELPVVASNWNGYRDSIINNKTGFLIDTKAYEPGLKDKVLQQSLRLNNQLDYLSALMGSQIEVDVIQAGTALAKLSSSKITARAMGCMGAQRARSTYDWSEIIKSYASLLESLRESRESYARMGKNVKLKSIPSISEIFEKWPSHVHSLDTKFLRNADTSQLKQVLNLSISKIYSKTIPSFNLIMEVHKSFNCNEPFSGSEVIDIMNAKKLGIEHSVLLSIGWLNKHGFLREVREQ